METLRKMLELLYFASGPALVVVAVYGLHQIRIAKETLEQSRTSSVMAAKRDSFKTAAEQCKYYYEILTPQLNAIDRMIEENNLSFFKEAKVSFNRDGYILHPSKTTDSRERITPHVGKILDTVNSLESLSLYFVSGVASEEAAFSSIGKTFCNSIEVLMPFILPISEQGKHFQNIMKLYSIWNLRLRRNQLIGDRERIEESLGNTKDIRINALGT